MYRRSIISDNFVLKWNERRNEYVKAHFQTCFPPWLMSLAPLICAGFNTPTRPKQVNRKRGKKATKTKWKLPKKNPNKCPPAFWPVVTNNCLVLVLGAR